VQDKLRALIRLAKIDASAREIDDQLRGIPRELDDRRAAIRALEALVAGQGVQATEAEKLLTAHDEELKQRTEMLSKSKAKGAKARNMREADASERELESIRKSIKDAETEKERLQGLIAQTRGALSGPATALEEQKTALDAATIASESRLAELRAEREKIVVGRDRFVNELPKPLYRKYERLRPTLHPLVAEVVDDTCTACHKKIPAQLSNTIMKSEDFHQCPHCLRFLFSKDMFLD
jgi:predicted  nucleic acid-binding Zn-ribbon protein